MAQQFDTIVVGAGPAGATAARYLASSGAKVLLLEKEKLPRYKVCGGGLVWRAREALEIPINDIVHQEFYRIDWKFRHDLHYIVERPFPLVSMIMRDQFDAFLTNAAGKEGVVIHDEESFEYFTEDGESISVRTDKDEYRARHLIAADGLRSKVFKQLNINDQRIKIPAIEAEIEIEDGNEDFFKQVIFDVTAIQKGYGWIFPKANHLSVGVAAMPHAGMSLKRAFFDYLMKTGLEPIIREKRQYGFQIPLYPHGQLYHNNILFTGDAAGLADPLVAEGISHAIFSGKWAARAIIENPSTAAGPAYQQLIKSELAPQIRSARMFSKLFYDYPSFCARILKNKGQYITEYVSDVFAGTRRYPDNINMVGKSIRKLIL
ncbi:NAD(P)/FAD-dependent oxidoreductase [Fulvivirga sedimenti]|uniref:Geranylgeranyl reductase family protein n=1 Tax=Fulvivirga sedimenti TaxID=2879465 RepID=A0A9X1KZZ0_9BACT|nr:geranylgeranyl reductase family protein [Fulvivirga sedimenti]MCA6075256.1 geranylgeranyl reductase family protein [Fulvivirga sedimenti]MCA6076433.1 geranylgeranyl reductase family protein [Fulvivirga sedimenti]MCA6077561.1 geranylgeranyl reductase family protein [Fulvivirga sedimenti]